jgi:outer membrane protein assembly factor BamD
MRNRLRLNRVLRGPAAAIAVLVCVGCGGVMPPIRSEGERLEVARTLIDEGDYLRAIELLQSYITNNPGGANVDIAVYLMGESHLRMKDWAAAQIEFERLLRDYPESDSNAAGAFGLGEALFGQSRGPDFDQEFTRLALDQWQRYVNDFPGHWRQNDAAKRIANTRSRLATKELNTARLYLKLKHYDPAETYFRRVIMEFGETTQAGEARIGLAKVAAARGWTQQAIDELRAIENEFAGRPLAEQAARERARLER